MRALCEAQDRQVHRSLHGKGSLLCRVRWSLYVLIAEGHRSCVDFLKREELAHTFSELTQGSVLHRLCCALKWCWIMRRRMTHRISCPEWFLLRLLFLHSKFLDDRNTTAWVMLSWYIQITKSPWLQGQLQGLEERCTKTNSECFQVVTTSVEEDKWIDFLMLELRSISIFDLAVTKSQSGLFSLRGFVAAFLWHMYHTILISR